MDKKWILLLNTEISAIVLAVFLKLTPILTLMVKTDGCKKDESSQARAGLVTSDRISEAVPRAPVLQRLHRREDSCF